MQRNDIECVCLVLTQVIKSGKGELEREFLIVRIVIARDNDLELKNIKFNRRWSSNAALVCTDSQFLFWTSVSLQLLKIDPDVLLRGSSDLAQVDEPGV